MLKFQWFECRKVLKKVVKYGTIEISIKMQKNHRYWRTYGFYIYQVYNGNKLPNNYIELI